MPPQGYTARCRGLYSVVHLVKEHYFLKNCKDFRLQFKKIADHLPKFPFMDYAKFSTFRVEVHTIGYEKNVIQIQREAKNCSMKIRHRIFDPDY